MFALWCRGPAVQPLLRTPYTPLVSASTFIPSRYQEEGNTHMRNASGSDVFNLSETLQKLQCLYKERIHIASCPDVQRTSVDSCVNALFNDALPFTLVTYCPRMLQHRGIRAVSCLRSGNHVDHCRLQLGQTAFGERFEAELAAFP